MSSPEMPERFVDTAGSVRDANLPSRSERPLSVGVDGQITASTGSDGLLLSVRTDRLVTLWQIVGAFERHDPGGFVDEVPSAEAVPVWSVDGVGDLSGGDLSARYGYAGHLSYSERLYHVGLLTGDMRSRVAGLEGSQGGAVGIPAFGVGDWVYACWNRQSGRWEVMGGISNVWRFELVESISPSSDRDVPSIARARLYVYDVITSRFAATSLVFYVADFYNVYTAESGTRGYARRLADSHLSIGWEIVSLQPSTDYYTAPSYTVGSDVPGSGGEVSSSSSSGESTPFEYCEECPGLPEYLMVSFEQVYGAGNQCDECGGWQSSFALQWVGDCTYRLGSDGSPGSGISSPLPCDDPEEDSWIEVKYRYNYAIGGVATVTVTIYNGTTPQVQFEADVSMDGTDLSNVSGVPIKNGSVAIGCDWNYAVCNIGNG